MNIPERFRGSKGLQYVISKGWNWREVSNGIEIEQCPFCHKDKYHFFMGCDPGGRDGLYMCQRCGSQGALRTLQEKLGDAIQGVESRKEWAKEDTEPLPDVEAAHQTLLADDEAMEYLRLERGFSREIIEKQKLGLTQKRYFREIKAEVRALVYPYLTQGNCVFVHYRTLPPTPKAFSSPKGWDAPLYNGEVLREGLTELIMVEGEANVIAALDKGVKDIVGVPGANFKKAMWIDVLDAIDPDKTNLKVYLLYDKDKVGQRAAQKIASRIGIERCYKIVLPDFEIPDKDNGGTKPGKDLNEWFVHGGGTAEALEELKANAPQMDVEGVTSAKDALDELEEALEGKETLEPTYQTQWKPLNNMVGFEDGDVIDIVAPEKIGKTTFAMNMMEHMVNQYGEDGIIICLEMTTVRLARKWVSHVTNTEDCIPKTPEEAKRLLQNFRRAIPKAREVAGNREGNLYFCYPMIKDVDDAYKLIHDVIRRYGVQWVMFDNLQLLADRTLKGSQNRTIHLSQISKTMAGIAKDYGIKMVRILQPHRIAEGKIISTDDVDGASQIAKDCDCMITLHRNPVGEISQKDFADMGYFETDTAFDSKMLVSVGLTRYSGGGRIVLSFNGATSTVTDYDPLVQAHMEDKKPQPAGSYTAAYAPKERVLAVEQHIAAGLAPATEQVNI